MRRRTEKMPLLRRNRFNFITKKYFQAYFASGRFRFWNTLKETGRYWNTLEDTGRYTGRYWKTLEDARRY